MLPLVTNPLKNGSSKSLVLTEFFLGGNALGLVPSNLPHTLGYTCTLYAPTSLSQECKEGPGEKAEGTPESSEFLPVLLVILCQSPPPPRGRKLGATRKLLKGVETCF